MSPTRLRAVLQALRWPPERLASALAIKPEEVQAWPDGKRAPATVAAWLETLAATHVQHPHPGAAASRIVFARRPSRRG